MAKYVKPIFSSDDRCRFMLNDGPKYVVVKNYKKGYIFGRVSSNPVISSNPTGRYESPHVYKINIIPKKSLYIKNLEDKLRRDFNAK